jgi:hypothetical protein
MRDILSEIVRQSIGLFESVKITGTEDQIKVEAMDNNMAFLKASLKPSPEFIGEFGLTNLDMLNGLLNFTSYKTEGSTFSVKRMEVPKVGETVVAFHFKDASGTVGAKFATMNPNLIAQQAVIGNIDWEVQTVPTKSKISEFTQLTSLYKTVDETFRATIVDKNLVFSLGDNHETTHNASMIFASGIEGKLSKDIMKWKSGMFLNILKIATVNNEVPKISISGRGPIGVSVKTENGTYNYVLRTSDSEKK